jgi:uncharacterized protein (TIRG00374 family)
MGQLKSRQIWLGLGGTVLFLALFFWQTDLREFLNAMRDADYRWAALGVMLWFVAAWPRSLRWKLILRPLRPLPVVILYPVLIIGYMTNNLLPARLGELVRAYILGERYALSKAAVLGTVVVERVADGLTLVALMAVAGAFIGLGSAVGLLAMAMAALFVVAFLILVVAMMKRDAAEKAIKALCQPLPRPWQGKVLQLADAFLDGLMALRSPWALVGVMATGGVAWALEAAMYFVVGRGFGIQGGFATFLVLTGAANLAIAVPSSAGGVGPFEWASQQVMVGAGVARGVASAYAVALHGLLLVPVIVVGLVFLWLLQVPLRAMARQPAEVAK